MMKIKKPILIIKKAILILGIFLFAMSSSHSQVTDVKFLIEYNYATSLYDCKIVIIEGEATTYPQRIQFNTQYTLVVPTGTELYIEELQNPKVNNQFYTSTEPCLWENGPKEISPPISPQLDYHSIFANLNPVAAYDNLYQGDTITLFSVFADLDPCENAIRQFENDSDPSSMDMPSGGDYSCGFTVGSTTQIYSGNLSTFYGNYIAKNDSLTICEGSCTNLEPKIFCLPDSLKYEWSTGDTTEIIEVCPSEPTDYFLLVYDMNNIFLDSILVNVDFGVVLTASSNNICAGESITLEGCPDGIWLQASGNPLEATFTSITSPTEVLFSESSSGIFTFIYTTISGISKEIEIIVEPKPEVSLDVSNACIGQIVPLSSNIPGGTWISNNLLIANVQPMGGLVSSFNDGLATFTYTAPNGCSNTTPSLELTFDVNTQFTGPDEICIGATTSVSPTTGGTWSSADNSVATITNTGIVTGVGNGIATLVFFDSDGCLGNYLKVTVQSIPTELTGPKNICIGETTTFLPNTDGTWMSSNPAVATITNSGLVTGVDEGNVSFIYSDSNSSCQSGLTESITVSEGAVLSIADTELCIGEITQLISNQNGTWSSSAFSIATISSTGTAQAINSGAASFSFTNSFGCTTSTYPEMITVNPVTETQLTGPNQICPEGTTTIEPSTGGTWTSSNPIVATIDNSGHITPISFGSATFTYTSSSTLCPSNPSEPVLVVPEIIVETPQTEICVNSNMTLSPSFGGTWTSDNSSVATINATTGFVTGVSSGQVIFTYTSADNSCSGESEIVTVSNNTTLTPIANTNTPICEYEVLALSTDFFEGTIYEWTGPNGFYSNQQNPNISNATPADAGTYCVVIFVNGCESQIDCIDAVVNPTPTTPTANNNGPICEGEDLNLSTDLVVGATYAWSGPNGFTSTDQNPTITGATPASAGNYCVIVTINGCDSYEGCTLIIVEPIPSTPTAISNGPFCEGEDITLYVEAFSGSNYIWTGPNGFSSNQNNPTITNATVSDNGSYCVIVYVDGCESEESCIDIIVKYTPTALSVSNNGPICEGEDLNLSTDFIVGATYEWTGPDGFYSTEQNPIINNADQSSSGNYCLEVTVDGCVSEYNCTDAVILSIPATPLASNNGPICEGEDIQFTTDAVPGASYIWTGPNGYISNDQNPIIPSATPSNNGVYCLVINLDGCGSEAACTTIELSPLDEDIFISNNSPVCIGDLVELSVDEVEGASYNWTGPGGSSFAGSTVSFIAGDVLSGTFEVEISYDNGCQHSNTTEINYLQTESIITEDDIICVGESTNISPISGGTYTFSNPNIGLINGGVFMGLNSGTTDIIYTSDLNGCESEPISIAVVNCIEPVSACDQIGAEDIICDFNDLANIAGTLTDQISEGDQPSGELCSDGDEAQNISWLGFVALEGDYEIVVRTNNCTPYVGGVIGAQVGVYSDCDFSDQNKVFCQSGNEMNEEFRIASNLLTAGQTYFLYIDGFDISVCDYSIDIDGFYDNTYCTDLSKVTGVAYIDENENGIYEVGEILLRNALISLSPGNFSVLTNDEGKYIINTPKGGATLTAKMNEGNWINNELTIEDLTIFEQCVEGIDFGFVPNLFYQEAKISVANTVTRCDWETRFYFTIENTGTIDISPNFEFAFDDKTSYFATNLIGLQVNGEVASAQFGTIEPFAVKEFWIKLKMPSGSSVLPILDFKTTLYNEAGAEMDTYEQNEQLRCSYDPNDKREFPNREGEENLTLMDEEIEYTIRFQNNGNDTAFQVKIVDPLDPNIEPTSIRIINSSHAVETCIENENLIFLFENINLVDSMTNYDGSQGYVSFRCNTKEGRAENTIVNNTADIIFDTNVPIVTNTTINTLVSELCTNEITEIDIEICQGDNYNGNEESGTYTEIHPLAYGCDSMVIIHLDVQGITYSSQDVQVCEGEVFELNGIDYILYESQEIRDTTMSTLGCIKDIFIFDVVVYPVLSIAIDTTICEGMEYNGLAETGVYTFDSFDVITGCDIITTIDLVVLPINDPSCIVGIDDVIASDIKLYPNPAKEVFYIESEMEIEAVSIYSMAFQKIEDLTFQNRNDKIQLSTEKLNSGLYIIAIKTKGKLIYKKLIID